MKLVHIVTDLERVGGAEIMLLQLLRHIDKSRFNNEVVSLMGTSFVSDKIEALGLPV